MTIATVTGCGKAVRQSVRDGRQRGAATQTRRALRAPTWSSAGRGRSGATGAETRAAGARVIQTAGVTRIAFPCYRDGTVVRTAAAAPRSVARIPRAGTTQACVLLSASGMNNEAWFLSRCGGDARGVGGRRSMGAQACPRGRDGQRDLRVPRNDRRLRRPLRRRLRGGEHALLVGGQRDASGWSVRVRRPARRPHADVALARCCGGSDVGEPDLRRSPHRYQFRLTAVARGRRGWAAARRRVGGRPVAVRVDEAAAIDLVNEDGAAGALSAGRPLHDADGRGAH